MKYKVLKYIFFITIWYGFSFFFVIKGHGFGPSTAVRMGIGIWSIRQVHDNLYKEKLHVSSYDFNLQQNVIRPILLTGTSTSNCYIRLQLDTNSNNDIVCTPTQEFYVVSMQQWVPAYRLSTGDELLGAEGIFAIRSIQFINKSLQVYALEIAHTHNFFVGPYAIVTHNIFLPEIVFGLGVSFGIGSATGGTAGSFFGPITFLGGAFVGGIIGLTIKMLSDDKKVRYKLHFDSDSINDYIQKSANNKDDQNDDTQVPAKKDKQSLLPKSGNYPFVPPKTKGGKITRDKKGAYIDDKGDAWKWDPRKNEWDVTDRRGRGHRNVGIDGNQTHKGTHPDAQSDTSKSKRKG